MSESILDSDSKHATPRPQTNINTIAEPTKGRARSRSNVDLAPPRLLESQSSTMTTTTTASGSGTAENHRHGLPPWDRAFDAVYHQHTHGHSRIGKRALFESTLKDFFQDHGRERSKVGFFRLPNNVRLLICEYVLAPLQGDKPVRLNRSSFNRDCWRDADFTCPLAALRPLAPYLAVSFDFRAHLLVIFLLQNTFHTTLSPYVDFRVNPLATTWLNRYGKYMRNIVIEVDMTRLGLGPAPEAVNLLAGVGHIEALLYKFVKSQLSRGDSRPLNSLVLLCRRFYGQRSDCPQARPTTPWSGRVDAQSRRSLRSDSDPLSESTCEIHREADGKRTATPDCSLRKMNSDMTDTSSCGHVGDDSLFPQDNEGGRLRQSDGPSLLSPLAMNHDGHYCPDSYLTICNHLLRLRGRVSSLRMCGFSEAYTNRFIATLFPSARNHPERHSYRVAPSTIWPHLIGQKSCTDIGDGMLAIDHHDAARGEEVPKVLAQWEGCVQLPPPVLDSQGDASLPPIVDTLQRMRNRALGTSISMSDRACPQLRGDLDLVNVPEQIVLNDKKKLGKLLDKYGKTKGRRRGTLTREISTTL
ncbi:hypothetical protein G7046_g2687 [Stylonectria norvegica]|nr:hypothetical protein G7046_g2687 [Stylonectria norvegica]